MALQFCTHSGLYTISAIGLSIHSIDDDGHHNKWRPIFPCRKSTSDAVEINAHQHLETYSMEDELLFSLQPIKPVLMRLSLEFLHSRESENYIKK